MHEIGPLIKAITTWLWQAPRGMRRCLCLPSSRRALLRGLAGAVALPASIAALAGFNFFTGEYTASREELQARIERRFPLRRRYAEVFAITLQEPRLDFDGHHARSVITARLSIESPLLRPSAVEGVVSVSSALTYDAVARALRLHQPTAERLELQGFAGRDAQRLQHIGALVTQELLHDYPLHSFQPEELTVAGKTYEIDNITIYDDAVKVALR